MVVRCAAVSAKGARDETLRGMGEDFGARDHCAANITGSLEITNIFERRSSPVIKDGAYQDIT